MARTLGFSLIALSLAALASTAFAQDDFVGEAVPEEDPAAVPADPNATEPVTTSETAAGTEEGAGTASVADEQAMHEERTGTEVARDSTDPYEDPEQGYYFLGAFYRHIFVPSFLLNLFLDDSFSGSNPGFGAELTYRKDNFAIGGQIWWAGYSGDGPVRASGDPEEDVEIINADTSVLFLSGSFMWSTPFNEYVALEYGVDLGLGFVFGDIVRTEAYPSAGSDSINGFAPCRGTSDPDARYCDPTSVDDGETGGHFGVKARNWADGGSVPIVVPWLAIPHLALRIKPIHQLQIKIEGGFGLGFFLGGGIAYGFD